MSKIALLIGRFQPIHKGHIRLIERYSKAGFSIKLGVGSTNKSLERDNPLTFNERKKMISMALKESNIKKFQIFSIPDIKEDADYVKHVLKIVRKFDTIITGNPRVLKLFLKYNCKKPWNIESFHESQRPGGEINASMIRKIWLKQPNKRGLLKSTFAYLKSIKFTDRLKKIKKNYRGPVK